MKNNSKILDGSKLVSNVCQLSQSKDKHSRVVTENLDTILGTRASVDTESAMMKAKAHHHQQQQQQKLYDPAKTGAFHVHGNLVLYSKKSVFIFDDKNFIRKMAVWLVEWTWFDRFIILAIILNSICLSLYDYSDRDATTEYNQILDWVGDGFTVLFFCEAALKILAMGFIVNKRSYLRDGWNFIDFVIVITGIFDLVATSVNLRSLRTLRVLRPLRSINAFPSMRRLVVTLFSSLPELLNATIFLSFIIILFGILGVQQFGGVSYYRCRTTPTPVNSTYWPKSDIYTNVCSPNTQGAFQCPENLTCGSPLQYGISLQDDNVYNDPVVLYGIGVFDHFGYAFLSVIQIITKDNWTKIMYNLSDGSNTVFAQFYCCAIIVFGSYFLLNLILAVIMTNFTRISQIDAEEELKKKEKEFKKEKGKSKNDLDESSSSSEDDDPVSIFPSPEKFSVMESPEHAKGPEHPNEEQNHPSQVIEEEFKEEAVPFKSADHNAMTHQQTENPNLLTIPRKDQPPVKKLMTFEAGKEIAKGLGMAVIAKALVKSDTRKLNQKVSQYKSDHKLDGNTESPQKEPPSPLLRKPTKESHTQANLRKIKTMQMMIEKTQAHQDLQLRLKLQNKMYLDQKVILERMEIDVKKKYQLSKRREYGIDNEQEILNQIKRGIKNEIERLEFKKLQEAQYREVMENSDLQVQIYDDNENPPQELENEILMSLNIAGELKQLAMKHKLKEILFNKFKAQLIQKSTLETMFQKVEKQMADNILAIRANKFFVYKWCLKVIQSKVFTVLIVCCIVGNSIVLALDRHNIDPQMDEVLKLMNAVFFGIFCFELLIKLLGMGFQQYFRDRFNWFDGVVVLVSTIDFTMQYTNLRSGAISALRIFRIFRIFQLARVWKNFQDLLQVISNTIKDLSNISVLLFLFVYTYTLLGMELFAYKAKFDDDHKLSFSEDAHYPESNFNSFLRSFLSVFIVLANDGWTSIYYNHYRATSGAVASVYFLSLVIVGQYILLNLFIAILIENFEQVSVNQDTINKQNTNSLKQRILNKLKQWYEKVTRICKRKNPDGSLIIISDQEMQAQPSLYIFKPNNFIRVYLKKKVTSKNFEILMFLMIMISSVQLAVDNPLNDPKSYLSKAMESLDIFLTVVFAIEALCKIIVFGFYSCGSTSYIRSLWNILDFFVVLIGIFALSVTSINISFIKILRLLKILRPLRVISRNQGLRISLSALFIAIPGIMNVCIISLVFFVIFGVIGTNYLKGRYFFCQVDHLLQGKALLDQMNTKWDCINSGGLWQNYFKSFDDITEALRTLFMTSTTVDWSELMYRAASSTDIDMIPRELTSESYSFYFVAFIIVSNFFLLNLFVGVVISTYNREKETLGKNFLLTEKQRKWLENKIMLVQSKPMLKMKLPTNEWRQPFFYLAEFIWFERFIYFCIISNTVILAIQWLGQPKQLENIIETINYAFAGVFTFEVLAKFIAYGKRYFKDGWNNFDIVIVIMTLISIILTATTSYQLGPQTTIVRSFKIGRIFKLFRRNRSLMQIFQTFLVTLPAMANIGSLLILFIFIYAIMGVYMFADIQLNGELNQHSNFQNVSLAFLTLMRISTGEGWTKLLDACSKSYSQEFQCVNMPTYDDYAQNGYETVGCGNPHFAVFYFFSYIILINLIYLKLFIAIILQGFQDTTERDNKLLDQETSDNYREVWSYFDPDVSYFKLQPLKGTTFMRASCYGMFLEMLGPPLGWDDSYDFNYLKQLEYLDLVTLPKYNEGKDYQFMDVFESLALLMIVRKEVDKYMVKLHRRKQRKALKDAERRKQENERNSKNRQPNQKKKKLKTLNQDPQQELARKDLQLRRRVPQTSDTNRDSWNHNANPSQFNLLGGTQSLRSSANEYEQLDSEQRELVDAALNDNTVKNQLKNLFQSINQKPTVNTQNKNAKNDLEDDEDLEQQIEALLQNSSLMNEIEKNLK